VLLAVALADWVGFTWRSLGLTIVIALAAGYVLHLGDTVLGVPISAMLILSVGTTTAAATGRIMETLVGAGAGLLAGLVFARPKLLPAAQAFDDLCGKMADLLTQMQPASGTGLSLIRLPAGWRGPIAERRDPAGRRRPASGRGEHPAQSAPAGLTQAGTDLRNRLEALELAGDRSPMRDEEIRLRLSARSPSLPRPCGPWPPGPGA
jgi:hypothetical protein